MSFKLGMDGKLYRNTGTWDIPMWELLGNVKDVKLNLTADEAEATTRNNGGFKAWVATLKEGSIEFQAVWDTEETGFAALKAAYFNRTTIELACMDSDITTPGSEGLHATMMVTNFSRTENLADVMTADVTIKTTYDAVNAPEWMETV